MIQHHLRREFHPSAPRFHSAAAKIAIAHAIHRAQCAHDCGRLINPFEAMALAGHGASKKDTLYSIARDTGWEDSVDVDELLEELEHRFPEYR